MENINFSTPEGIATTLVYGIAAIFLIIKAIPLVKVLCELAYMRLKFDYLSDRKHRHRITYETVHETPDQTAKLEAQRAVNDLIASEDWLRLSDLIEEWDQGRTKSPSGHNLYLIGLERFLSEVRRPTLLPHETTIAELADHFEGLCAIHPNRYPLVAMTASLHMSIGWDARGSGYANSVSKEAWQVMERTFERAEWLISRTTAEEKNSPLLASVQFETLAFTDEADKKVIAYYETWSKLDPTCQEPHYAVGFKLLPRWFGDLQLLEKTARQAAARTNSKTGMAAYYSMLSGAFSCGDPLHLVIDTDLLSQGAHDLVALRQNDPVTLANVVGDIDNLRDQDAPYQAKKTQVSQWQSVNDRLHKIADNLIKTRLTAISPSDWQMGETGILIRISEIFRDEMEAGHHFEISDAGVSTHKLAQ